MYCNNFIWEKSLWKYFDNSNKITLETLEKDTGKDYGKVPMFMCTNAMCFNGVNSTVGRLKLSRNKLIAL